MKIGKHDIRSDNIGSWPKTFHLLIILLVVLFLLFLGYWFDLSKQIHTLKNVTQKESILKTGLAQRQQIAANLAAYKKQLTSSQQDMLQLIKQLPTQSEVPSLIEDISKLGKHTGLKLILLQPQEEQPYQFYSVLPIHITVSGTYQQIALFVSELSSMNRIVTIGNFSLQAASKIIQQSSTPLRFDFTAQTYRYSPYIKVVNKQRGSK